MVPSTSAQVKVIYNNNESKTSFIHRSTSPICIRLRFLEDFKVPPGPPSSSEDDACSGALGSAGDASNSVLPVLPMRGGSWTAPGGLLCAVCVGIIRGVNGSKSAGPGGGSAIGSRGVFGGGG